MVLEKQDSAISDSGISLSTDGDNKSPDTMSLSSPSDDGCYQGNPKSPHTLSTPIDDGCHGHIKSLDKMSFSFPDSYQGNSNICDGNKHLFEADDDYGNLHYHHNHKTIECALCRKKQQRHALANGAEKAPSVSELSVTSSRASRSPWGKDLTADARPITDPALRSKLRSARSAATKVTSRDQKILELMLAKREDSKKDAQKREAARLAWEDEKQREAVAKNSAENARRRTLSEHRRLQESRRADMKTAKCKHDHNHNDHDEVFEKDEVLDRKHKEDEVARLEHESAIKHCDRQWATKSQKVLMEKEAKLAEKRRQNMERKKSADERLQAKMRDEQSQMQALLAKKEKQIHRASSMKEAKEMEQVNQRKVRNLENKKKQEERKHSLDRQSREDLNQLKSILDSKLTTAESRAKALQTRRSKELRRSMTDLDSRFERSKENQLRMEEELQSWRQDLLDYRKMSENKAEELAKKNILQKKKKAVEERIAKERAQKENLKKLMKQEEEWKMDVEATLAMKDARARMVQMEKDEMIQESRAMAQTSQMLREELRQAYASDSIGQLSRKAEMEAKLTSQTANLSLN